MPSSTSACAPPSQDVGQAARASAGQGQDLLQRVGRILTQKTKDKLYALHAPEVECISKGKACNPYEFGMRSMPGNPYDGHTLEETIEQVSIEVTTGAARNVLRKFYGCCTS